MILVWIFIHQYGSVEYTCIWLINFWPRISESHVRFRTLTANEKHGSVDDCVYGKSGETPAVYIESDSAWCRRSYVVIVICQSEAKMPHATIHAVTDCVALRHSVIAVYQAVTTQLNSRRFIDEACRKMLAGQRWVKTRDRILSICRAKQFPKFMWLASFWQNAKRKYGIVNEAKR